MPRSLKWCEAWEVRAGGRSKRGDQVGVVALIAVLAVASAHCASATAVTPAPIGPEDAPKLQAALVGSCHVTGTQKPGGEVKAAKGIHFTFQPTGKLHYHLETPLGAMDNDYSYHLDGRNIVSDGTYKTMRVDEWGAKTLKLFLYDITETYYCTKE